MKGWREKSERERYHSRILSNYYTHKMEENQNIKLSVYLREMNKQSELEIADTISARSQKLFKIYKRNLHCCCVDIRVKIDALRLF